ncbi:Beta-fructofuranosidase 1 [Platanthera guangdongensis]|uniref:Beta-fructofuranosidase 1 n=1 Tax=Platanthera guangdongensis TaxID=2320717 RepID=A0ABR2MH98_9ASPA
MSGRDLDSTHSQFLLSPPRQRHRSSCPILLLPLTALLAAVAVILLCNPLSNDDTVPVLSPAPSSRGAPAGVSEKSTSGMLGSAPAFPWTNNMLAFQRTAFHFQPEKNWMNDPDGPLFYKGWYHLFYQYNPASSVWGNIAWGHAVSRDLINWEHLSVAMMPDRWYDFNGVWSGSATILPDGRLVMLYTGSTHESVQVQNIAFPADPADPLLLHWVKSDEHNPVISPPEGIQFEDFRDPTTAWHSGEDSGTWLLAIGSKNDSGEHAGMALVYRTRDFVSYEPVAGVLHSVAGTGMWECVDLYPVHTEASFGLDTSAASAPAVRHVLKVSLDDDKHDYYGIGRYYAENNSWVPDDPDLDIGVGFRLDYGKYYAAKSFYDQNKRRRVVWGWSGESDSEQADMLKGWASVQTIPRTVLFDVETGSNLLLWPVEELDTLRFSGKNFTNLPLPAHTVKLLEFAETTQVF